MGFVVLSVKFTAWVLAMVMSFTGHPAPITRGAAEYQDHQGCRRVPGRFWNRWIRSE